MPYPWHYNSGPVPWNCWTIIYWISPCTTANKPAIASGYKAILVKNAPEDVKDEIMKEMKKKGLDNKLYIAKGGGKLNGNYSSGIIEGLVHFGIIEQE